MLRIGIGTDTHRLVEGRELVLGGVHIASDRGAEGHSDADALDVMRLPMRFSVRFVKVISEFISRIRIHSGVARIVLNCFRA